MPDNPNPQGKGLVPVLEGLARHRITRLLPPKQIDQVEMELFTSLFVLSSDFKFNPVPGQCYHLYQCEGRFRLMMVGPDEWHTPFRGRYIGECELHEDRTWSLALDAAITQDQAFMERIEEERAKLHRSLEEAETVEQALPVYEERLGFYGRVLAFTLGKSLDASMGMAGIRGLSYSEARGLLTGRKEE